MTTVWASTPQPLQNQNQIQQNLAMKMSLRGIQRERESTATKAGDRSGDFGAGSEVEIIGEIYKN